MNCSDMEILMMKYMDGELSKQEAECLNEHLSKCPICLEYFKIYDFLLEEIEDCPHEEAPVDFENEIMSKIACMPCGVLKTKKGLNIGLWGYIWGAFFALFASGMTIVFLREPIMEYLSNDPNFYGKIKSLEPIQVEIMEQSQTISVIIRDALELVNQTLISSAGIILVAMIAVCGIQYYILYQKKKEDGTDDR